MTSGIVEYISGEEDRAASAHIGHGTNQPNKPGARLPSIIRAKDLVETPPAEPPMLIHGLLHRGEKMLFGAGSKAGKTWLSLDIALSVACGVPFMDLKTEAGRVLYVNLELPNWSLARRLDEVRRVKAMTAIPDDLHIWTLRGTQARAEEIVDRIIAERGDFALTILDPLYKILGGRKENAAEDMASLLNVLERLTTEANTALICPAHFAKGDSSAKESLDRISGSGVFSRDADAIVTMTRHEQEDCFTIEPTLRTMKSPPPFVVRWEYPLFRRQHALDPSRLRSTPGRKPKATADQMLELLPAAGLTHAEWGKLAEDKIGLGRTAFNERLKVLKDQRRVSKAPISERYCKR